MPRRPGRDKKDRSYTIDELARKTKMTVRNIRAHQSRGLLPAPEVRGRTGYYGAEHLSRLELIQDLQADGFNLEAIRRVIEQAGGSTEEVLKFTQAVRAPFADEEPRVVELPELAERWGDDAEAKLLERAIGLGILRDLGDGRLEEPSPRLADAGLALRDLGISVGRGLDVIETLREHADGAARAFVALFLSEVWEPFDRAGRPPERWPEVREALDRLRPLAAESLLAIFEKTMTELVDETVNEVLEHGVGEGTVAPLRAVK